MPVISETYPIADVPVCCNGEGLVVLPHNTGGVNRVHVGGGESGSTDSVAVRDRGECASLLAEETGD